jgi:hypothetical protein|tara:strand:+ start:269 stop:475 length:207 start_codon:yes stop_codon:yes gene_type:complete
VHHFVKKWGGGKFFISKTTKYARNEIMVKTLELSPEIIKLQEVVTTLYAKKSFRHRLSLKNGIYEYYA